VPWTYPEHPCEGAGCVLFCLLSGNGGNGFFVICRAILIIRYCIGRTGDFPCITGCGPE